ncbi:MAG TPA: RecQ family ATP-dependent DNA helicase, partial [Chitinophagaceae bacterium]|nr:RecQ family ATP-dependent DNA helicase [Chitinophagaceae bacterium]
GDDSIRACGICDNCLRQKAAKLTREEFENLYHRIINMIKFESLHTKDLLLKLNGIKKEKAWKVIEFLQAENKIEMDKNGWVRLK